jgi:hypothetical protein
LIDTAYKLPFLKGTGKMNPWGFERATGIPNKKPCPELRSKKNFEYFIKELLFSS